MTLNKSHIRKLHSFFAPIMLLPILLTLVTGSLYQIAIITGKGGDFMWLLDLHRGKFGRVNLEIIYPLINAFGLLMLAVTGITIWFQIPLKKTK
ncbi:MAG: PepSY domain-containing protein [Cyanobacteria bacterium P01_A01_bin.45]